MLSPSETTAESAAPAEPAVRLRPSSDARASSKWIASGLRQQPATTRLQRPPWVSRTGGAGTEPSTRSWRR